MPPKGAADPKKKVHPPFYAFGKLDKKGQISDKKGAAALAKATQAMEHIVGAVGRDRDNHADATVEYAQHLGFADIAFACNPLVDVRAWPRCCVDPGANTCRQYARDVACEATAGLAAATCEASNANAVLENAVEW